MPTLRDIGEDGLLARLRPLLAEHTAGLLLGTGDDCAITQPDPRRLVWTIDAMVEGAHFRFWPGNSPRAVGWKLAASNLSDLASKGATPLYALLSAGFPGDADADAVVALHEGVAECLAEHGARLIGGDTVRAPQWTLSLTLVGALAPGAALATRSRARPGMTVYCTGHPGESGAGFRALEEGRGADFPALAERHLRPRPRVAIGRALVEACSDLAMLDCSDGPAKDASRVAAASSVRVVLESALFPISPALADFAAQTGSSAEDLFLFGGEDYELLFATAADFATIHQAAREAEPAVSVTAIGRVEEGEGLCLEGPDGSRVDLLSRKGFEHF
ncbi:MAG: thiamine-phosphate kinase [Sumerlaeia bacterium]